MDEARGQSSIAGTDRGAAAKSTRSGHQWIETANHCREPHRQFQSRFTTTANASARPRHDSSDGDYPADIVFDTQAIPLQPILAVYAPSQAGNLTGQTEVHATLRGPLKEKTKLEAHIQIPQLSLNYKNTIQLAESGPIRADYTNGVLNVQKSVIRGTGTEITFQANIPTAQNAKLSMLVRGNVDLQLAQLLSPDITSGGQVQFDIDSFGSRSEQNVQGQIRIVNASFASAGLPLGLSSRQRCADADAQSS